MAYTPTNWQSNDVISATLMNKLQQGVAAAGQDIAWIRLSATGFSSGTKTFGYIVYAIYQNDAWVVSCDEQSFWVKEIGGFNQPLDRIISVPIPKENDVKVFLLDTIQDEKTSTGDISSTATQLYYSFGSVVIGNAYQITGNGSFTFIGT